MTPMEGRSLLKGGVLLLALSLVRFGSEHWRYHVSAPEEGSSDLEWLLDETRQARDDRIRRTRPLAPGETLDPNRSPEEELNRLPGVGPATATAMVAERERSGGFQRPEDLLRVRGIGPATLERIRPFLDFSEGIPRELLLSRTGGDGAAWATSTGVPGTPVGGTGSGAPSSPGARVDVNRASAEELQTLPGIGPALAERILQSRARDGPFRTPEDLLRIQGIGPVTLARIRDLILAGSR